jgi:DNA methylase
MSVQLSILDNWGSIRTPKVRASERTGIYAWAPLYSAYSEQFVAEVLRMVRRSSDEVVLDPFIGGGTTAIAAVKLGHPVIGADLDPFSCILSRAAVAVCLDHKRLIDLLAPGCAAVDAEQNVTSLFREDHLTYAKAVFDRIVNRIDCEPSRLLHAVLADRHQRYDTEAVALAALGIAASYTARISTGSNPVWVKTHPNGTRPQKRKLHIAARRVGEKMLDDLRRARAEIVAPSLQIFNVDIRHWQPEPNSVDLVVTSPPYLNRLDYVVHHIAPLTLYSALLPIDLEGLRRSMIGTTKIIQKIDESSGWGPLCRQTLDSIATHPSYASKRYYYWTFHQYFKDLHSFVRLLSNTCRSGARGVIVAQNSFYKEFELKVPEILIEVATILGIESRIVKRQIIRTHMGKMSPRQPPTKTLEECVLLLEFS